MIPQTIPKLCGGDVELCNFFSPAESPDGTGSRAALALLKKIDGVSGNGGARWESDGSNYWSERSADDDRFNAQDQLRTFLPANGGCAYIDLNHLEICLPEVLSARDHVAAWRGMLQIAARAQAAVNAELPQGQKVHVLANNSDGRGNSFGSHLNFLITRQAWESIFHRRLQYLLFIAAYQASSIVFTGQGKVGSEGENGAACDYQISQRADFIEVLMGIQTTYNRPLVNSRDEPLCGSQRTESGMARLHVIFYDSNLCDVAGYLKVGVMQIILTMIEAGRVKADLILEDPVEAVRAWSRDPGLNARAALVSGMEVTAVELQLIFLEEAKAFVDAGHCEGIVPEADKIVQLWEETLAKLKVRDFGTLVRRLDWVLKRSILERAMTKRSDLSWESPEIKHLDHWYSSLDGGLYLAFEKAGATERLVCDADIERFASEPPDDTRAWVRSRLLRLAGPDQVEKVDWDSVTVRLPGQWPRRKIVGLANPLNFTKAKFQHLENATIEVALECLDAQPVPFEVPPRPVFSPRPPLRYRTHIP